MLTGVADLARCGTWRRVWRGGRSHYPAAWAAVDSASRLGGGTLSRPPRLDHPVGSRHM